MDLESRYSLLLQSMLWCAQRYIMTRLKWASHMVLCWSSYHFLFNTVFEVGAAHLQWLCWEGNSLLWMWALFEEGMTYLAWWFTSLLLWHVLDPKWSSVSPSFGIKSRGCWLLGFFLLYIYRMGLFRRDVDCLLKVFYCFKALFCSASSDVFFVLHSVEEGDEMGGVAYCTPNI